MEYYVAMRKNEIWPFVATWMELESVLLSEISHTEKDTICFTLMLTLRNLEDHRGREGKKKKKGREPNHKRLLKTEN